MSTLSMFQLNRERMENDQSFRKAVLSWTSLSYKELISFSQRHFLHRLVDRVNRYGVNPN
jgi:hypothetical protein